MVFDILALDSKDHRSLPLQERLAQIEMLLLSVGKLAAIGLVPSFDDGQALVNACMEHSLEGVVSKRRASTYTSGQGRHWAKSKTPTWRQANKDRCGCRVVEPRKERGFDRRGEHPVLVRGLVNNLDGVTDGTGCTTKAWRAAYQPYGSPMRPIVMSLTIVAVLGSGMLSSVVFATN
jgi:hypothetical protein